MPARTFNLAGCGGAAGGGLDAGQAGVLGRPGALAVIGDRGPFALRIAAALDLLPRERAEDLGLIVGSIRIDRGGRGDRWTRSRVEGRRVPPMSAPATATLATVVRVLLLAVIKSLGSFRATFM